MRTRRKHGDENCDTSVTTIGNICPNIRLHRNSVEIIRNDRLSRILPRESFCLYEDLQFGPQITENKLHEPSIFFASQAKVEARDSVIGIRDAKLNFDANNEVDMQTQIDEINK